MRITGGPKGSEWGQGLLTSTDGMSSRPPVATSWSHEACVPLGPDEWRVRRAVMLARSGGRDAGDVTQQVSAKRLGRSIHCRGRADARTAINDLGSAPVTA